MNRPLCYLAGAIAGLQFDDATDWRYQAGFRLSDRGIEVLNPMRAKEVLADRDGGVISTDFRDYAANGPFFTSRGIMTRDFTDVTNCDVLLVNLLGLKTPSIGTIMELAWAYVLRKPTVVAMECAGNPHDNHPMLVEAMSFRVPSLDDAIEAVSVIVNR